VTTQKTIKPKKTPIVSKSSSLKNKLAAGVLSILVITLGLQPSVQNELAQVFGVYEEWSSRNTPVESKDKEQVLVNRVVDGDTIVLEDGRKIRYLYVDTPETKKPGAAVYCFGPEASEYNKKLVEHKEIVMVKDKDPQDRYGRELRLIYLPGEDTSKIETSINAKIVNNGFARAVSYSPNTTYKNNFQALEKIAQQQMKGLWGSCDKPFVE
jgi:micrococcal nuclease